VERGRCAATGEALQLEAAPGVEYVDRFCSHRIGGRSRATTVI
jgi:hypothetical protein